MSVKESFSIVTVRHNRPRERLVRKADTEGIRCYRTRSVAGNSEGLRLRREDERFIEVRANT